MILNVHVPGASCYEIGDEIWQQPLEEAISTEAETIADYAGKSAHAGTAPYLSFLALISISLGILNLLPVPLLDGGNLMYYVFEIVRGRPVSERALEIGQQVGLFLLLTLMAFAFYNDISRLLSS